MSTRNTAFMFQNRPTDDGKRTPMVGVSCKMCHRVEWAHAQNAGWGTRIFKGKGWLLGSTRDRDKCPGCRKQTPGMAGASTPASRRAAYLAIEARHDRMDAKTMLQGTSLDGRTGAALVSPRDRALPLQPIDPTLTEPAKMAEALSALGKVTTKESEEAIPQEPSPRTNSKRSNAITSAKNYLQKTCGIETPTEGVHFAVEPKGNLVEWRVLAKPQFGLNEPLPLLMHQPYSGAFNTVHTQSYAAKKAAQGWLRRMGTPAPEDGVHYRVVQAGGGTWRWELLRWPGSLDYLNEPAPVAEAPDPQPEAPKEEAPMTTITSTAAPATPTLVTALPPRQPTRADIRAINDRLDVEYDVERQRYKGNGSDQKVAAFLNLPRAWVSAERERAFGPEANEEPDPKWTAWQKEMAAEAAKLANQAMLLAEAVEALQGRILRGPL